MSTMIPDIQFSILCDEVRQEINGHFQFLGVLAEAVRVPQLPMNVGRLFVVNRWTSGQGQFKQKTTFRGPDGTTVVAAGKEIPVPLANGGRSHTCFEAFMNIRFETAGTYWVEVELDGQLRMRYPFTVFFEPPKQA